MSAVTFFHTTIPADPVLSREVRIAQILTNFRNDHIISIQKAFNEFALMIFDSEIPLKGTRFEEINVFFGSNGGMAVCKQAWDRNCLDLERVYFLARLCGTLRVDILDKIQIQELDTEEARQLYFFICEFSDVRIREEIASQKVHELSEFIETEHSQLRTDLSFEKFLKTMQAIHLFAPSCLMNLEGKHLNAAETICYWRQKLVKVEEFPSCAKLEQIIRHIGNHDFSRILREERFELSRWKAYAQMNKLTEKQLLIWNPNGSNIHKNYVRVMGKMKRKQERMVHVSAIDVKLSIEHDVVKGLINRIAAFVQWLFGMLFQHTFFVTYEPEEHEYYVHGRDDEGVYHHVSGNYKLNTREYEIDIGGIIPIGVRNEDCARFEREFFDRLEGLINQEDKPWYLPCLIVHIYMIVMPHFWGKGTIPGEIDVRKDEARAVTCNQFIGEAIVQAHVETCRLYNVEVPEDLGFYGFRKGDDLGWMSPTYFMECLIKKGVLRECWSPIIR